MTQGFYEQLGVEPDAPLAEIRAAYTRVVGKLSKRRRAMQEADGDPSPLDLARVQVDEAWTVLRDPVRRRRYDAMRVLSQEAIVDGAELWKRAQGALIHPAAAAAADLLRVVSTLKIGVLPPSSRPESSRARPGAATGVQIPPRPSGVASPAAAAVAGHGSGVAVPNGAPSRSGSTPTAVPQTATGSENGPASGVRSAGSVFAHSPNAGSPAAGSGTGSGLGTGSGIGLGAGASPRGLPAVEIPRSVSASMDDPRSMPSVGGPRGLPPIGGMPSSPAALVVPAPPPRRKGGTSEEVAEMIDRYGYSGALLKAVRESRMMSLQDVSDNTRITIRYLEAIEAEQRDQLPSPTFVRGYVREIARLLGLDEEATMAGYMRRLAR